VAFHPNGNILAASTTDQSIKLWDIRMHKLIQYYGDAHSTKAVKQDNSFKRTGSVAVNSVAFGGDHGEWLVSTGHDGYVKVGYYSGHTDLTYL
jgi:centriolar protein POC1